VAGSRVRPMDSGAPDVAGESHRGHTRCHLPCGGNNRAGMRRPRVESPAPFELTPAEVAEPGFSTNGGGRRVLFCHH